VGILFARGRRTVTSRFRAAGITDEFLERRYPVECPGGLPPTSDNPAKKPEEFRNYRDDVRPGVREFYRLNHRHQTLEFVRAKKRRYLPLQKARMGVWGALEFLNRLVDDSDPDTDLSQIEHLLQTAEAIRQNGNDWPERGGQSLSGRRLFCGRRV
jgi:inositol oxygenase